MKALVRGVGVFLLVCLCWLGCGKTPPSISLHQGVEKGDLKAVQQHIEAKTDLNKTDASGRTALHVAVMKGNLAIVTALVKGGADVTRKGKDGRTALDIARARGQPTIVQYLQERSTKPSRRLVDGGLGVLDALDIQ